MMETIAPGAPGSPVKTLAGKSYNTMNPGDLLLYQLDLSNAQEIAKIELARQGQVQEMTMFSQKLAADEKARMDEVALMREQMAQSASEGAANRAMAMQTTQMEIANRLAIAQMDRDTRLEIAHIQENLEKLGFALNASISTGYIPGALANQLGIKPGPTLEAQDLAWKRFMEAMSTFASNPRNIVGYLSLTHGISPSGDINAPVPFLAALSGQQENVPQTNIGANQEAISTNAREFAASQAAAIPPMFTDEQLNPAALQPIAGVGLNAQLAQQTRPNQQISSGISGLLSKYQKLFSGNRQSPLGVS